MIIEDLQTYDHRTGIEEDILAKGVRNMVVAPIYYQDELIGILQLGSPHPGDFHALNTMKLREVLPLFALAIRRIVDELNTRVQAVIKEQCTAIHPAVEWRFRQAAMNWMAQRKAGIMAEMEPIVFDHVYPLYGVSDIRGSSSLRSDAIRADLIEHLDQIKAILRLGYGHQPLPILAALVYRVDTWVAALNMGLGSGDEISVIDFVQRDIEPMFARLQALGPDVATRIQAYQEMIDPRLGTIYRQRKDFENSVTQINDVLSTYLDAEQEKAQAMFPHYFEKHKTDGIEFGIYIGASLVEDGQFDMLYLYNLRLWQLMTMCGLVRQAKAIQSELELPLATAHLILVQDVPLSVRFRIDEKRFDVDGAYNVRYEIVKKRIDKALIKGTHERLTQPGKIAIVYAQSKEAIEYRGYINYLQSIGYLTHEVEELELTDLDGAQGLKALRVTVDIDACLLACALPVEHLTQVVEIA